MRNKLIIIFIAVGLLVSVIMNFRYSSKINQLEVEINTKSGQILDLETQLDSIKIENNNLVKRIEMSEREALRQAKLKEEALSNTTR